MKQDANPVGVALERLQSILEPASRWATIAHSMSAAREHPEIAAAIIARELAIRDAISESCRVWIETGNLQPMDDQDARYFFDRLKYGEKVLLWIRSGDFLWPKASNELLTFLLIDSWDYITSLMWLSDLSDLASS